MNNLDKVMADINKRFKTELVKKGVERVYVPKIPFSSPRANYMTYGGIPVGKATEFLGGEGGGKTTSAVDVVGQAQKKAKREYEQKVDAIKAQITTLEDKEGKTAQKDLKKLQETLNELTERGARQVIYVDTENTFDEDWAELNGVNLADLILIRPQEQTAEQVLQMMLDLLDTGLVELMVLDSIPMLVPKALYEEDMDKRTYGGASQPLTTFSSKVSPIIAKHKTALIMINQVREDMNNPFNLYKTTGGRALKHLYALRLYFRKGTFIDESNNEIKQSSANPYGNIVDITIVKTKVCKPDRRVGQYTLNYFEGIDKVSDTVDMAIKYGYIAVNGSWYTLLNPETGEILQDADGEDLKYQGRGNIISMLKEDADLFNELYTAVDAKLRED